MNIKNVLIFISILFLAFSIIISSCTKSTVDKRKILYYANPMDPTIKSDKPMKDSMGMDYVPVYENEKEKTSKIWYYTCPNHPEVKSHNPGKCPKDNQDLIPVYYPEMQTNAAIDYYYCPMHSQVKSNQPGNCPICQMELAPRYKEESNTISSITLTSEQEKIINVQTSLVEYKAIDQNINTIGKINYSEKNYALVTARFAGRADKLFVNFTGMSVDLYQPLLLIYSPSIITTEQELLQANKDYQSSLTSNSDYADMAKSLLNSTKNKLKLWGLTEKQIELIVSSGETMIHIPIYSPIKGTVIKMNVITGMYVEEGTVLYELADLDKVWMEADVYEKDIANIKVGNAVDIISMSYPDKVLTSRITFISPVLDQNTRTIKIRAEFINTDNILKPGMYVNANIKIPTKEKMLVIPASALLDTGMRKIVYISQGNGKYTGRNVIIKQLVGNYYPIIEGVMENERVVTNANFLIDSESQLKGNIIK